ncbi:MAG TPA: hypothetical protein VF456_00040 [Vicinamibacterales bacterium]
MLVQVAHVRIVSTMDVPPSRIREILLETVRDHSDGGYSLQSRTLLAEARQRLVKEGSWDGEVLMTLWGDLFLQGVIGWGADVDNPSPPFVHLTKRGRTTLANLTRDPSNPDGYRANLSATAALNPIADSYIFEALATYNAACYKATAAMVGCAAESLLLELRDAVTTRLTTLARSPHTNLGSWKALTILRAVQVELDYHKAAMHHTLREAYESYWPAFTQQLRAARNDAGHPSAIDPVRPEIVHASLLIFPELARLARQLIDWVTNQMP